MLFFAFFSRVCFLLPKLPQYKLGCKGTKKCAHTQASGKIILKKVAFGCLIANCSISSKGNISKSIPMRLRVLDGFITGR